MNAPAKGRFTANGCLRLALAGAVLATLIVAACGGKENSELLTTAEPCRLFTRAELRLQFNVAPKRDKPGERYPRPVPPEGDPLPLVGADTCGADGVYVAVGRTLAPESFAKWKEGLRSATGTVTPVTVRGAKGVWDRDAHTQRLVVLDGETIFGVADTTGAAHGLERAKSLAAKALAKL